MASLPASPDLAVIATPADTVPALIKDLGEKGTRAAVVITAGIRDELKQAMLDARPYILRIQGPNCVGLMLPHLGLNASFAAAPRAGDIAFLSQSGALITGIIDWASARNIGFSHVVSMGDMADEKLIQAAKPVSHIDEAQGGCSPAGSTGSITVASAIDANQCKHGG